jgi:dTDP-4-amino-4,6-dideoxygalactose transaminase
MFDEIQAARRKICKRYSFLDLPQGAISNNYSANFVAHMFYIQFLKTDEALYFKRRMNELEISVSTHYQTLSNSSFAKKFLTTSILADKSEQVAANLVRLPLAYNLSEFQIDRIFNEASIVFEEIKMDL